MSEEVKSAESVSGESQVPEVHHGIFPWYLLIIFVFVGIWACFSWVPFFGY